MQSLQQVVKCCLILIAVFFMSCIAKQFFVSFNLIPISFFTIRLAFHFTVVAGRMFYPIQKYIVFDNKVSFAFERAVAGRKTVELVNFHCYGYCYLFVFVLLFACVCDAYLMFMFLHAYFGQSSESN